VLVDGKEVDFIVNDNKVTVKTPQSYKKVQCIG
jgi:hypothetical protein